MRFPARNPNRKAGDKKVFLSNRGEASRKELKHESFFIKRFFFLIFYFFFFFFYQRYNSKSSNFSLSAQFLAKGNVKD